MASGIYSIDVNNKVYIGSAVNLSNRLCRHRYDLRKGRHPNIHLQRTYNKYGEDAFKFNVLEVCSKEDLLKHEQFWIDQLKATNPEFGFNMALIAGSNLGKKMSDEAKIKMRKPRCKEFGEAISIRMRGRKLSEEHKKNIGLAALGKKRSNKTSKDYYQKRIANYKNKMMPHKYFKLTGDEIKT